jgi:hypothetical protein
LKQRSYGSPDKPDYDDHDQNLEEGGHNQTSR